MTPRRITIVTAGHPSTCPRMVKAADAAVEAGYSVRFVSVDSVDWASRLDGDLVARRRWAWDPIPLRRAERPAASRWASARYRLARYAVMYADRHVPQAVVHRAYARTHPELVTAILAAPFDLVYGGTVAALAATAVAARRAGKPFALDLEDFHPAESQEPDAPLTHRLADAVVRDAQSGAAFLTTASRPMAEHYRPLVAHDPVIVHNVVPLPAVRPQVSVSGGPLRLYWFSQTVGPTRGLEEVVIGVALAGVDAELTLRGVARAGYVESLRELAQRTGARLSVVLQPPAEADRMVDLCREHHIGVSSEQPDVVNRDICVPNKIFAYMAAGLAIVATDTEGHRSLPDAGTCAIHRYRPGDPQSLAAILREWDACRTHLTAAREASWHAARERFHWEHPSERGTLLNAFARTLS